MASHVISTLEKSKVEKSPELVRAESVSSLRARRGKSLSVGQASFTTDVPDQIQNLFATYAPLAYQLPWEALDYIELLSTYNPDYSQAVDNIKTLANSGHNLFIAHRSQAKMRALKERLEEKARTVQERHGGIDGLIDKLLDQAATYGAMCGEWILDEDLEDVIDFVDINPKKIRFFWDSERNYWAPYQMVTAQQAREAEERGQETKQNHVRLNDTTFHYYAFDAAPGSPYGTPPFLAALANIAIQRDMVNNLGQIVKKIGLLGMIDLTVKLPSKSPGESQEAYEARAGKYLDDYADVVEDMARDGGMVHYDDASVQMHALAGNAAGATNIFKQNEELIFSGLKSMPSVQGRSYSTTETYAGVAYDIIIRNTYKYQKAVKRMIESGYYLMALTWGEQPKSIKIQFNSNKSLHRLQNAQAEKLEILNAIMLWVTGLLDQDGYAQRLGFAEPVTEYSEVPVNPLIGTSGAGNSQEEDPDDTEPNEDEDNESKPTDKRRSREDEEEEEE